MVIQLHRELADRAREAFGHVLDATDRLVREPSRDDSRFIDAGSTLLAGERMRAELELPIEDMIEAVHGDHPWAHPPAQTASPVGVCQWYAKHGCGRSAMLAAEAIMLSGAMLRDPGRKFWNNGQWQLRVTDAAGNKICPSPSRRIAHKGRLRGAREVLATKVRIRHRSPRPCSTRASRSSGLSV